MKSLEMLRNKTEPMRETTCTDIVKGKTTDSDGRVVRNLIANASLVSVRSSFLSVYVSKYIRRYICMQDQWNLLEESSDAESKTK